MVGGLERQKRPRKSTRGSVGENMKVAIVRGNHLSKFEVQNYEPLTKEFELVGYAGKRSRFEEDLKTIGFPVKRLYSIEDLRNMFPTPIRQGLAAYFYKTGFSQHLFGLEKELRDKDIAHTLELRMNFSLQAIKAKRYNPRLKVVNTVWQNIPHVRMRTPLGTLEFSRKVIREIIDGTDVFVAVTERAKETLLLEGVPEEKVELIPVGVNTDAFKPRPKDKELMANLNIGKDDFVILYVGRMVWEKGPEYVLNSFKLLNEPKAKLVMIGSGPESKWIDTLVKRYGIEDKVIYIPKVPYVEMPRYYSIADVFVLPSTATPTWQEQFGMVFIEAMASGVPVIAGHSGSIPEVVGDAGILVPPTDFHELAKSIRILLEDEELRRRLRKRGLKRVQDHFNISKTADKIKKVYNNLE